MFLGKGVLKICSKCLGQHQCQSAISIKLQSNFIEIALWHGCSPVNFLHIFRISFSRNTSGWLLLYTFKCCQQKIFIETFYRFLKDLSKAVSHISKSKKEYMNCLDSIVSATSKGTLNLQPRMGIHV